MAREKFQQKAVKQTKQKKSTSAEFLMVKECGEATEGAGNPGFNMSSPELAAHQTPEGNVIRRDMLDHTLAAHQQKSRLPASAGPKGNEYSRNYFDPLMEEEINSRQCRMEVSRRGELELRRRKKEGMPDWDALSHSSTHEEAEEATPAHMEEAERRAPRGIIRLAGSPSGQDLKFERKGLSQDISMSCLKKDKAFGKSLSLPCTADGNPYTKGCIAEQCSLPEAAKESERAERAFWKVLPQRNTVKPGWSFLFELVFLRETHVHNDLIMGWAVFPVCDNNFRTVEGKFKCPLLRGPYDQKLDSFRKIENLICQDLDKWLCNLYFKVIKTPLHLDDQKSHESRRQLSPEHPVCLMADAENTEFDLDNTASPSKNEPPGNTQAETGRATLSSQDKGKKKVGSLNKRTSLMVDKEQLMLYKRSKPEASNAIGNISDKIEPCPRDCDLGLFKGVHDLHTKGESLAAHSVKGRFTVWRPGEPGDYSEDMSYLEELEQHRVSVCCPSVADGHRSGELSKHLHFAWVTLFSELELARWQSQSFWYILLLVASLWFLRLYMHYLGQWLFLWALSTPVTKFQFYSYTVDLCYPISSLHIGEELAVIVLGPLALNTITFPLLLIRWGCQLLFSSCPDALSKLIVTMGLWTVLDPLAVFIVDAFLGRLAHNGETPVADAAKLYWMFLRTKQPAILGAGITVVLYTLLFVISSLILYLYCLRSHNDSWILDAFQRIHSEETKFFMPYDLEISNQELSHIVKRSEQWRGINGERRKELCNKRNCYCWFKDTCIPRSDGHSYNCGESSWFLDIRTELMYARTYKRVAVHDYICKSHDTKSSISSCDPHHQDELSASAVGPGGVISHISIYTAYSSGFQELHRHFLRLPDGAIIEVFGDISALRFVPSEVITAVEEHIREIDTVQREDFVSAQEKRESSEETRGDH